MTDITKQVLITVDTAQPLQTIDGFGVNINSKYWNNGALIPVMELLIDNLGATIFRLDAYGKSNWVDPTNELDAATALTPANYKKVYAGKEFQSAQAMGRYLNNRGIQPYITLSGIVPTWMCGPDGLTLTDYASFGEMAASYVQWLREDAGIDFKLFCPLNEVDIGPPEGPHLKPVDVLPACLAVLDALDKRGLTDIRLVYIEQAGIDTRFIDAIRDNARMVDRIDVIGLHLYIDTPMVAEIMDYIQKSPVRNARVWMTEYGDLDQTGENEWHFSQLIFGRLVHFLKSGYNAALNWDAFDNYHDHDETWTNYGIIRRGLRCSTPKKRFYACKHIYRFVRPGWIRLTITPDVPELSVVAFMDPVSGAITVSGMNISAAAIPLGVRTGTGGKPPHADFYLSTSDLDCARQDCPILRNCYLPTSGYAVMIPSGSIFTITTEKPVMKITSY